MSFHSWDDFKRLLFDLSKQERKGKKDAELISPATYVDGTTRIVTGKRTLKER